MEQTLQQAKSKVIPPINSFTWHLAVQYRLETLERRQQPLARDLVPTHCLISIYRTELQTELQGKHYVAHWHPEPAAHRAAAAQPAPRAGSLDDGDSLASLGSSGQDRLHDEKCDLPLIARCAVSLRTALSVSRDPTRYMAAKDRTSDSQDGHARLAHKY